MSASLGPDLRQQCQYLILAFLVKNNFLIKNSKSFYLEKIRSVLQQIIKPQTKHTVSISVNININILLSFDKL